MPQAHSLCNFSDAKARKVFRNLISACRKRVFDITEERAYVKTHALVNSVLNLALAQKNVELYDIILSHLLSIVLNLLK